MKKLLTLALIFSCTIAKSQSVIDWEEGYDLQLSDFKSPSTEIGDVNIYSLSSASQMGFQYQMSNIEFMFTKNFNGMVDCSFNRNAAALVAPDSVMALQLLSFANYDFDLTELYSRKLRKKLWENKGAFSDPSFFKPIYDELREEMSTVYNESAKQTDLGVDEGKLAELHQAVIAEIQALSDFCKTCKPPKKKK